MCAGPAIFPGRSRRFISQGDPFRGHSSGWRRPAFREAQHESFEPVRGGPVQWPAWLPPGVACDTTCETSPRLHSERARAVTEVQAARGRINRGAPGPAPVAWELEDDEFAPPCDRSPVRSRRRNRGEFVSGGVSVYHAGRGGRGGGAGDVGRAWRQLAMLAEAPRRTRGLHFALATPAGEHPTQRAPTSHRCALWLSPDHHTRQRGCVRCFALREAPAASSGEPL